MSQKYKLWYYLKRVYVGARQRNEYEIVTKTWPIKTT